ncbi:hypothetical protein DDE01_12920 [Desulfovibrio desulfuricans]|nr:hypothetical protein DDE01_12920 [Desulfovibrio desulfuricans]
MLTCVTKGMCHEPSHGKDGYDRAEREKMDAATDGQVTLGHSGLRRACRCSLGSHGLPVAVASLCVTVIGRPRVSGWGSGKATG